MDLKEKEKRFDNFLNKTIILSSKKFYKEECNKKDKEFDILDNKDFDEYINKFIETEELEFDCNNITDLINKLNNVKLIEALKSLSSIEKTVIFFLFYFLLIFSEVSKILKICSFSVTRIRRRAIKNVERWTTIELPEDVNERVLAEIEKWFEEDE